MSPLLWAAARFAAAAALSWPEAGLTHDQVIHGDGVDRALRAQRPAQGAGDPARILRAHARQPDGRVLHQLTDAGDLFGIRAGERPAASWEPGPDPWAGPRPPAAGQRRANQAGRWRRRRGRRRRRGPSALSPVWPVPGRRQRGHLGGAAPPARGAAPGPEPWSGPASVTSSARGSGSSEAAGGNCGGPGRRGQSVRAPGGGPPAGYGWLAWPAMRQRQRLARGCGRGHGSARRSREQRWPRPVPAAESALAPAAAPGPSARGRDRAAGREWRWVRAWRGRGRSPTSPRSPPRSRPAPSIFQAAAAAKPLPQAGAPGRRHDRGLSHPLLGQ